MPWIDEYQAHLKNKAATAAANEHRLAAIESDREGRLMQEAAVEQSLKPVTNALGTIVDKLGSLNINQHAEDNFSVASIAAVLDKYNLPQPEDLAQFDQDALKQIKDGVTKISRTLGGRKSGSQGATRASIDQELEVFRRYKEILQMQSTRDAVRKVLGEGTVMYYKDVEELKNRLKVIFLQMRAGNVSSENQNESIAIIDKLCEEGYFNSTDKRVLYEKAYSF